MTFKYFLVFTVSLFLGACSSTSSQKQEPTEVFQKLSDRDYKKIIKSHTQDNKEYEGFYNTYQVKVTMLNSQVQEALLQREGFFMQWSNDKARSERAKVLRSMNSKAKFFVSLYTPNTSYNDLDKGNTIWKVYVEQNGSKYEGKVIKKKRKLIELKNLFPHYSRFSRAYEVEFNVPMNALEKQDAKFTLASSLGHTEFVFSATK